MSSDRAERSGPPPVGDDPSAQLAAELRATQAASGRSLRELEGDTHSSSSSLSRYLTGRSLPPWTVVEALCTLADHDAARLRPLWEAARKGRSPVASARNDLPRDTLRFVGRADERRLLLAEPGVWALDGMAGVGKTALAVHTAHLMAGTHPDGRFYLNLHGHTSGRGPMRPGTALETLLRALGLPGGRIPEDGDERAALWRAELASRRAVVVLDNAVDEEQVAPLLPGTTGSAVLVTSRRRLVGLDNVRSLSLDVITPAEAVELFHAVAGPRTGPAEQAAVEEIVRLCGCLPLAVRICAARLRHRPAWSAGSLAERLRGENRRLPEIDAGDGGIAAALALSASQLDRPTARLFGLLGSAPSTDVDPLLAAALAGSTLDDAEQLLEDLVDVHMLELPASGRYRLHDLTRDYARGCDLPDRAQARHRMLDYYLHCTIAAARLFDPYQAARSSTTPVAQPPAYAPELTDREQAVAWWDAESGNLVDAARAALEAGEPQRTIAQARKANRFFLLHGRTQEWITMSGLSLQAARQTGSAEEEAWSLLACGAAYRRSGDIQRALAFLHEGRELALTRGPVSDEGFILNALAVIYSDIWDLDAAIENFLAAVTVFEAEDNTRGTSVAMVNLAEMLLRRGRVPEALERAGAALRIFEAEGHIAGATKAHGTLGAIQHRLGAFDEAGKDFTAALDHARRTSFRELEVNALNGLAMVARDSGDLAAAFGHHAEVARMVAEEDHPDLANFLNERARTHLFAGQREQAAADAAAALALARERGNTYEEARALRTTAALASAAGHAATDQAAAGQAAADHVATDHAATAESLLTRAAALLAELGCTDPTALPGLPTA
ncbi:ATP-binding protein [Streptacidiphilus cavernicola]|uniref:Tetratricopeptide repeat protein n=1 Tax=Streptacidiphilus cavernicola TaxID=3342716 RepID=A0ABV6W5E6_9ACTN